MHNLWSGLLANTAVVALLISVWTNFRLQQQDHVRYRGALALGFLFGAGALGVMAIPIHTASGSFIDLRVTVIGVSGFLGGPVAGIVTALVAAAYRISLGGSVTLAVGLTTIGLSLAVAIVSYWQREGRLPGVESCVGLSAALAVSAVLPSAFVGTTVAIATEIWFPVMTLVFATSLMASLAVANELRRRDAERRNYMYQRVIDSLPEALNVKDTEGRFLLVNPATAALMHADSPESLLGKGDADFYPPDIAKEFRAAEECALRVGRPVVAEQRVKHLDGGEAVLSTLKSPFTDNSGNVIGLITHNRDITEQKRLEAALARSDRRAAEALSNISDGLVMFDKDLILVFCNERYRSMFAKTADLRVPGTSAAAILYASIARGELVGIAPEDARQWVTEAMKRLRQAGTVQFPLADGRWIESRTRPTEEGSCFVICSDITETKRHEIELECLNKKLLVLAETDGLTGLLNRRAFDAVMEAEIAKLRVDGGNLSLLMVDVDHFKRFNDNYGHGAGDVCLKTISECLRGSARRLSDRAARYGGEELALILPGADEQAAVSIAEDFRARLRDLQIPHTGSKRKIVTGSIGVATAKGSARYTDATRLIAEADQALYAVKEGGRDGVKLWEPGSLRVVRNS
ncbi:diguanylate cyclase [Rhizobium sp. Leaf383]|uniref:diguanylate cyclase n=1 Tax=Rhizobium sp. Leaf383 TaxID=1736357 RepID=UPI00138EDF2D|nr:diguanylate cyclase [Rhizobium sp. Leaf383]